MAKKVPLGVYMRRAPAKINLYLDVLGRRPDGYHDLETVMQSVTLADEITLDVRDGDAFSALLTCDVPDLSVGEDNLILRAARAYAQAFDVDCGVHVFRLQKKIPMQAGLGGGSADAAAALWLMEEAHGRAGGFKGLLPLAEKLGADVPFCLLGGRAFCTGIGEKLTPIGTYEQKSVLIAIGRERISTPEAFRKIDTLSDAGSVRHGDPDAFLADPDRYDLCRNRFELLLPPEAAAIRSAIENEGALTARMSGSGPALFGIFPDPVSASSAASRLSLLFPSAFVTVVKFEDAR